MDKSYIINQDEYNQFYEGYKTVSVLPEETNLNHAGATIADIQQQLSRCSRRQRKERIFRLNQSFRGRGEGKIQESHRSRGGLPLPFHTPPGSIKESGIPVGGAGTASLFEISVFQQVFLPLRSSGAAKERRGAQTEEAGVTQ